MSDDRWQSSSGLATKIGSRGESSSSRPVSPPERAWTLRLVPITLVFPALLNLAVMNLGGIIGVAVALGCCYAAMRLVEEGRRAEFDFERRTIAKAPSMPRKTLGSAVLGIGLVIAGFATAGLGLGIVLGAIAGLGSLMAYGVDPRQDKGIDPGIAAKAGVKLETVVAAITEAESKLVEIDRTAATIRNRELRDHLHRITTEGRNILSEIERDPGDIRRARRFLVTYLDGTRDVVSKFAAQQQDLADSPLGENFRHVLETIETVFGEQIEVLKKNESLDLEVQIDVLKTQLEREGVA